MLMRLLRYRLAVERRDHLACNARDRFGADRVGETESTTDHAQAG